MQVPDIPPPKPDGIGAKTRPTLPLAGLSCATERVVIVGGGWPSVPAFLVFMYHQC